MTLSKLKDGSLLDVDKVMLVRKVNYSQINFTPACTHILVNEFIYVFESEEDADKFIEEIYELSTKAAK